MPGGIRNPEIGYLTFCAVKFVGYSAAAGVISEVYNRKQRRPLLIGAVRTLIGMVAGAAYYSAWKLIAGGPGDIGYLAGLLPIRVAEWWLLIWLFYDRHLQQQRKGWCTVGVATAWSFALDIPAAFGFLYTAGVWIC